jgi:hypothetical protein
MQNISNNLVTIKDDGVTNHIQYDVSREQILNYARELVRNYADTMVGEGYYLDVRELPDKEKKLLLAYVVYDDFGDEAEEMYQYFIDSPIRLQASYKDYRKDMQYWINEVIEDVYQCDVYERNESYGLTKYIDQTNGEVRWL